jgi:PAS domain S-box-containing protein
MSTDAPDDKAPSDDPVPIEVALLANTDHAVIVADPGGAITFWNPAAEKMFGHPRAEMLGRQLDVIIPENLRRRHWDGYRRVMATGETRYAGRTLSVPALRADGTRISIEFTVTLVESPDGSVAGIGALVRDVTERWEERRAERMRLAELEREVAALRG